MGGPSGSRSDTGRRPPQVGEHAAVSVVTRGECCSSAEVLSGLVMLASDAPSLPLESCSMPGRCLCSYREYSDRRLRAEDRRFPYGKRRAAWFMGVEKRKLRGRRVEDD
jgi:hypothetical protein